MKRGGPAVGLFWFIAQQKEPLSLSATITPGFSSFSQTTMLP